MKQNTTYDRTDVRQRDRTDACCSTAQTGFEFAFRQRAVWATSLRQANNSIAVTTICEMLPSSPSRGVVNADPYAAVSSTSSGVHSRTANSDQSANANGRRPQM